MLEEEIHTLLVDDVYCNLFDVDGSAWLNEVPNKLKCELPELGIFTGLTNVNVNLKYERQY
jgi:hypothetical protein